MLFFYYYYLTVLLCASIYLKYFVIFSVYFPTIFCLHFFSFFLPILFPLLRITHHIPILQNVFFFHLVTFLFPAFLCFIFPSLHSCILPSPWKQKYPRYAIDLNNIFLTSRENFYYMSLHNVWWSRFSIDFYLVVNSMNSLTIKWICSPLQSPRFRNLFPRLFATQG